MQEIWTKKKNYQSYTRLTKEEGWDFEAATMRKKINLFAAKGVPFFAAFIPNNNTQNLNKNKKSKMKEWQSGRQIL